MKKLFSLLIVTLVLTGQSPSQTGITGVWRAVGVAPDGTADGAMRDFFFEFQANGTSLKTTVTGLPIVIREGRIEGNQVTLSGALNNQPVSFTGNLSGNDLLLKADGLGTEPFNMAAHRVIRVTTDSGSISDAALMKRLLEEYKVPGVSIAVIKDFKVAAALAYGVADKETNMPVTTRTMFQAASISKAVAAMASLKAVQENKFSLDQDINTILKSWKLPMGQWSSSAAVTPRMLMSHTSGMGDGYGFPGYAPGVPLPTVQQILDGVPPSNVRSIRLERAPGSGFEYSGGGALLQQLVLTDAAGKPFERIARQWILDPLGLADSTFEQPLPAARQAQAARAHDRNGARMKDPWRVHPEQAAAGLWTTPTDLARIAIELQLALQDRSSRVLAPALAREMVTPVGVGTYAVGFGIARQGEGWYFLHGGSNWGFQADLTAHRSKGYGAVIMTNSDSGGALIPTLLHLIQEEYEWDALDAPIPRRYGP